MKPRRKIKTAIAQMLKCGFGDQFWVLPIALSQFLKFSGIYAIVIRMPTRADDPGPTGTSVLSIRVSSQERALLVAASEQARTSLSDFVRRKALEAAEVDVLRRTVVTIPAKDWEAFEAWVTGPPKAIPALRKLARKAPTWQS